MGPEAVRPVAQRLPPHAYFVGSAVFHYLGPAFAVLLFWCALEAAVFTYTLMPTVASTTIVSKSTAIRAPRVPPPEPAAYARSKTSHTRCAADTPRR